MCRAYVETFVRQPDINKREGLALADVTACDELGRRMKIKDTKMQKI